MAPLATVMKFSASVSTQIMAQPVGCSTSWMSGRIDAGAHEVFDQTGAEGIGTDAPGHGDRCSGAGGGDGLISNT